MKNKYLISDPLDWLLEQTEPSVCYLTKRDVLENADNADYSTLVDSHDTKMLLSHQRDYILGDTKNYDIYYRGTMWFFAEAVARGLDKRTKSVEATAQYILEHFQLPSGGITLKWAPPTEDACRTGDMVRYLVQSGIEHEGIIKGITWIITNQRHDGGWLHSPVAGFFDYAKLVLFNKTGSGLNREKDLAIDSCPYATLACAMALCAYNEKNSNKHVAEAIQKAADYMLNWLKETKSKEAWYLGFPVLYQYDILYALVFLAKAGRINDARTGDIFNSIMLRQNGDGTWNLENKKTGMLHGHTTAPRGRPCKWVTLNVLRMLKYAGLL